MVNRYPQQRRRGGTFKFSTLGDQQSEVKIVLRHCWKKSGTSRRDPPSQQHALPSARPTLTRAAARAATPHIPLNPCRQHEASALGPLGRSPVTRPRPPAADRGPSRSSDLVAFPIRLPTDRTTGSFSVTCLPHQSPARAMA